MTAAVSARDVIDAEVADLRAEGFPALALDLLPVLAAIGPDTELSRRARGFLSWLAGWDTTTLQGFVALLDDIEAAR